MLRRELLYVCQAYPESHGNISNCSKTVCMTFKAKGGITQNPVTAYEPAYGQRESPHMQQEHHHRQPPKSVLLKMILSKPEGGRNRENSPGYGQRSLCEDCRWP